MERFFNAEGPIKPDIHYYVPMLERFHSHQITALIEQQKYFLMHAARQTGKTSCLLAYMRFLNAEGKYKCLYTNVESGQASRDNVAEAMRAIMSNLAKDALLQIGDPVPQKLIREGLVDINAPTNGMNNLLSLWAAQSEKPIVLLLDEVDALVGDSLISLLRQIRAGYSNRPETFPQSIILCGVRDIQDYRIHGTKEVITGGSAFNIKAESLTMSNFSEAEVRFLYHQHTLATGQQFEDAIYAQVMEYTGGQPWMVNALAYDVCFREDAGKNRSTLINVQMFADAKERLIYSRRTHLDQLIDKLKEPRVQRVIEPMLVGSTLTFIDEDDVQYLIDLGLIIRDNTGLRIANAIYREVIPRELNRILQINLDSRVEQPPVWYLDSAGNIDERRMLTSFQEFFRENADIWLKMTNYEEAAPQLLLQAYLQRVINGGGRVQREYALGRGRADLLVEWRHPDYQQKIVIELKIKYNSLEKTLQDGLAQTAEYMERCGVSHGNLLIFDRTPGKSWDEKIFIREETVNGKTITIYGM